MNDKTELTITDALTLCQSKLLNVSLPLMLTDSVGVQLKDVVGILEQIKSSLTKKPEEETKDAGAE